MKKGRKSKYEAQVMPHLEIIAAWCRDGATERDIAKKLGISLSSLNKYKADFPEFSDTLKRNKELADVQVENALFRAATGYEYEEVKTEYIENGKQGQRGNIRNNDTGTCRKVTRIKKVVQGDVTAQIFWLKNRKPREWRDKQEFDVKGFEGIKLIQEEKDL